MNGYTAGLFPRSEVFELPTIFTNDIVATNLAMREMFAQHLRRGVSRRPRLLPPRPCRPGDPHGRHGRAPSGRPQGQEAARARPDRHRRHRGSSARRPCRCRCRDLPQALTTHAVDGALIPWEIIPALKLQDSTQYQIEGENNWRFGTTTFQVSMNKARWEVAARRPQGGLRQGTPTRPGCARSARSGATPTMPASRSRSMPATSTSC